MPREITDRPDADGGASLGSAGDGNSQRAGQQALKPFGAHGPIGIVGRDGSRCPLRLHEPKQVARPRPGNGGGPAPAA
jgi:hypothetical protein